MKKREKSCWGGGTVTAGDECGGFFIRGDMWEILIREGSKQVQTRECKGSEALLQGRFRGAEQIPEEIPFHGS